MATTLLNALASIPLEQLVEGLQIHCERTNGERFTVTIGERIENDEVLPISHLPRFTSATC